MALPEGNGEHKRGAGGDRQDGLEGDRVLQPDEPCAVGGMGGRGGGGGSDFVRSSADASLACGTRPECGDAVHSLATAC